jgi:hypothetical protein
VGAGLVATLPAPTALRLLPLLAVPVVPCAVWVLQFTAAMAGNASQDPFPVLAFPSLLHPRHDREHTTPDMDTSQNIRIRAAQPPGGHRAGPAPNTAAPHAT